MAIKTWLKKSSKLR